MKSSSMASRRCRRRHAAIQSRRFPSTASRSFASPPAALPQSSEALQAVSSTSRPRPSEMHFTVPCGSSCAMTSLIRATISPRQLRRSLSCAGTSSASPRTVPLSSRISMTVAMVLSSLGTTRAAASVPKRSITSRFRPPPSAAATSPPFGTQVGTDTFGNAVFGGPLYDPNFTRTVGSVKVRDAFPDNKIPSARFSAVAGKLLNYYPTPTNAAACFERSKRGQQRIGH